MNNYLDKSIIYKHINIEIEIMKTNETKGNEFIYKINPIFIEHI